ncbi:MAG TPA: DHHA1 domain-containing protein, partial [Kofleriaceae bacterium]|nr:DHHA1 domain-containing protein [Kofleriaceae bacterium]
EVAVASREAGYGFTMSAAVELARRACKLVITGDCGTNDLEAIAASAARGIEVIVIDHHTVPAADVAHPSVALVNPFRSDSTFPFRGMASVGLAFYVAAAVRTELRDRGHFRDRPEPDVRDLLDLVALGTIADLVPLAAENRILTSLGLRRLGGGQPRPGIAAMLAASGFDRDREVDAGTVAWRLAPRLNAPGRLGAAEPALALLLADEDTATERAQALETANLQRREIQARVLEDALAQLGDRDPGPAIVLAGEGWTPGVVGIVAAKLVETYQRPAFVIAIDPETGLGRGSARTCGGVNLYDALCEVKAHLGKFGGHAAAAGFSLQRESVAALAEALGSVVGRLAQGSGPVSTSREIDAEVRLGEVDERLATELAGLGPFGQANPQPLLVTRRSRVTAVRRVGDGSHLKLTIDDERSTTRSAIGFRLGDRLVEVGALVDLAFAPVVSTWQGHRSAELELSDLAIVS